MPDDVRTQMLARVDKQLIEMGLLDAASGQVSKNAREETKFERKTSLPTAGVIVKGRLDDCNVCEPEVERKMTLELDQMELENKLLARQIELLDKAQEHRCCPAETET